MSDFIQLSREFFKSKEWKERRSLSDAEAVLYMIGKAGFEAKTELYKGKYVRLQAGELMASERFLAEEWIWDKAKVARFLRRIVNQGYISRRVEKGVGLIKIKRLIIHGGFEAGNEATNEAEKQGHKCVDISDLSYRCASESRQQTRQRRGGERSPYWENIDNKRIEGHLAAEREQKEKPPLSPSFFPPEPPFYSPPIIPQKEKALSEKEKKKGKKRKGGS